MMREFGMGEAGDLKFDEDLLLSLFLKNSY